MHPLREIAIFTHDVSVPGCLRMQPTLTALPEA
jgi:hypothetical protein